ncbi:hypothetical protein MFIFM68171_11192 [Madurella fahalii]|uniref:Uncharacterized protein n=1 Tax=Madurella fahalii TaxID=1157608 RepID=A0ABQ0GTG3_9PEZI
MKLIITLLGFAALVLAVDQVNNRVEIPPPAETAHDPCGGIRGVALNAIAQFVKANDPCGVLPSGEDASKSSHVVEKRTPIRYNGFTITLGNKMKPRELSKVKRRRTWQSTAGNFIKFNVGLLMVGLVGAGAGVVAV